MFPIKSVRNFRKFTKFYSTLYIPDNKAMDNFALLTPYINFDEIIANKDNLIDNFKKRNINKDFQQMEEKLTFYRDLKSKKTTIENNRDFIIESLKKLGKNPDGNTSEHDKLRLHLKVIKEDLKNFKEYYYDVEESVMLDILKFPNKLHQKTPMNSEEILYEYQKDCHSKTDSHMDLAKRLNLIKYVNETCCYLKNDAAVFEISILNYFQQSLLNLDFLQFSNPSFVKSIVAEGCGLDYDDKNRLFTLTPHHENDSSALHLVGSASFSPYMAYFTKHILPSTRLPLKCFSVGRIYYPTLNSDKNLFNFSQQSGVCIFCASNDEDDILDELTTHLTQLYKDLGRQFRVIRQPAYKLHSSESYRLSIEMFSNYLQCYVEVGNVSCYDDYLSKRLLFNYTDGNKNRSFPKVIAGCVVNVHKILGCAIENNAIHNGELVNAILRKYFN